MTHNNNKRRGKSKDQGSEHFFSSFQDPKNKALTWVFIPNALLQKNIIPNTTTEGATYYQENEAHPKIPNTIEQISFEKQSC